MNNIETMELALKALESWHKGFPDNMNDLDDQAITALRQAIEQAHKQDRHELQVKGEHPAPCARFCEATAFNIEIRNLSKQLEQIQKQEPDFITHAVENAYDWSEWVCPDPKGYLMKCCDCGLVHEAQFKVVRYRSETEREDCDPVDDPNVQAVFRMRRSEQWSPEDTAHRAGGLPMEQAQQAEPVGEVQNERGDVDWISFVPAVGTSLYTSPPPRQWVGLTKKEFQEAVEGLEDLEDCWVAIEAKLKEKNT